MTRGGGKAFVYTGPFVTGSGGPPRTFIDLTTWGTFSRASEASYLIGAATTGSTPFMRWAAYGARRFEDRGDGNGQMLLLEGARENMIYPSERFDNIWASSGGLTLTNNAYNAPDGELDADRVQTAGTGDELYNLWFSQPSGVDYSGSVWRRAPSGTSSAQDMVAGGGAGTANAATITTTWTRAEMKRQPHASTTIGLWVGDGGNRTGYGGTTAGARDEVAWGAQLEKASFASSYIRTSDLATARVTRSADILSGATTDVPSAMINGTFSFDIAPIFSSADGIRHAADQCIFSFAEDDSERIFFVVSGGSIYIRVTSGGATKVTSNALTFSAHQKMSVTINGSAGSITVGGATTGNGTVTGTGWTRTTGATTYVGSRQGGTQPVFARLGPLSRNPSTAKIVLFMLGQSNMQVNSITSKILGRVQDTYPLAKKVEWCVGGTTLYSDWAKSGGVAYANALAEWDAAVTRDPDLLNATPIIVWGQGETDSSSAGWTAAYGTNLPALFVNIETDRPFFAGCRKIIHMLYPTCGLDTSPGHVNAATIRSAESAYQAANPTLVATVDTSDLTTYDTIHFDDASTTTIAQRDAAIVRGWIA